MTSKRFCYDELTLAQAITEIRSGKTSIRAASRIYGVPKSTIQDRISGRIPEGPRKMGPNTVLNMREEKRLVKWMTDLTKCGFPRKPDDLLNTVQNITREENRKTPFKDYRPGKTWYAAFLKRHPELSLRTPQGISKGRAIVTEESIRLWFRDLESYLESQNASDVLLDPKRVFNCDETSFSMCPKTGKVIAPVGWKNVYTIQPGNEKETITVLFTFSADGDTVTPMVVFPHVRPPKEITDSVPDSWFLGRSETGWMRSETFFEYIANGFNQWLTDNEIPRPVVLFLDGHKSHLTMELSEFCHENQIILYCLPPNTTHIMQPADVSVFKPLKGDYKKTVREWQNQNEVNSLLSKVTFCPLIKQVLEQKDLTTSIQNGFRKSGLFPLNPDAVDYSKCVQNAIENLNLESCSDIAAAEQYYSVEDMLATFKVINTKRSELNSRGINVDALLQILGERSNGPAISQGDDLSSSQSRESDVELIESRDNDQIYDCSDLIFNDDNFDFTFSLSDEELSQSGSAVQLGTIVQLQPKDLTEMSAQPLMIQISLEQQQTESIEIIPGPSFMTQISKLQENHEIPPNVQSSTSRISDHTSESFREPEQTESDNCIEVIPDPSFTTQVSKLQENVEMTPTVQTSTPSISNPISKTFKKHLFCPKPLNFGRKRRDKVKTPMAISSTVWRKLTQEIEDQKLEKSKAILKRKTERIELAKSKADAIEQRKIDRIEKAKIKAEAIERREMEKIEIAKEKAEKAKEKVEHIARRLEEKKNKTETSQQFLERKD